MVNFVLGSPSSDRPANERPGGVVDPTLDPLLNPDLYDGILFKRVVAYLIDLTILMALGAAGFIVMGILGVITLGLAFAAMGLVLALIPILYHSLLIGGPRSATLGMRFMGIEVRRWYGGYPDMPQAFAITILFYGSIAVTVWLILLLSLFSDARRCLHDLLTGTVVVNAEQSKNMHKRLNDGRERLAR